VKIGDLVELSAYGKKLKVLNDLKGDIGIVIGYNFGSAHVKWTRRGFHQMNRRDIKNVRT